MRRSLFSKCSSPHECWSWWEIQRCHSSWESLWRGRGFRSLTLGYTLRLLSPAHIRWPANRIMILAPLFNLLNCKRLCFERLQTWWNIPYLWLVDSRPPPKTRPPTVRWSTWRYQRVIRLGKVAKAKVGHQGCEGRIQPQAQHQGWDPRPQEVGWESQLWCLVQRSPNVMDDRNCHCKSIWDI